MNKTIIVVFGYGKVQPVFDRHLPLWEAHGFPILVCSPVDDPLQSGHEPLNYGLSEHHGRQTTLRCYTSLEEAVKRGYAAIVLMEYDAFCLRKEFIIRPGLHGIISHTLEPRRFIAPRYVLPPWTLDGYSARKMLKIYKRYPEVVEEGYMDRLLAAWAFLAGVPILPLLWDSPPVATLTPSDRDQVRLLASRGVCYWHGVKDAATFDLITNAYRPGVCHYSGLP